MGVKAKASRRAEARGQGACPVYSRGVGFQKPALPGLPSSLSPNDPPSRHVIGSLTVGRRHFLRGSFSLPIPLRVLLIHTDVQKCSLK